jgi:hypothetical protein
MPIITALDYWAGTGADGGGLALLLAVVACEAAVHLLASALPFLRADRTGT